MESGTVKSIETGESGWVKAVVTIWLYDLIEMDIEVLNDWAEETIDMGILSDINYRVVSADANANTIDIEVFADICD